MGIRVVDDQVAAWNIMDARRKIYHRWVIGFRWISFRGIGEEVEKFVPLLHLAGGAVDLDLEFSRLIEREADCVPDPAGRDPLGEGVDLDGGERLLETGHLDRDASGEGKGSTLEGTGLVDGDVRSVDLDCKVRREGKWPLRPGY